MSRLATPGLRQPLGVAAVEPTLNDETQHEHGAARATTSEATTSEAVTASDDAVKWLASRSSTHVFTVTRIPLADLRGWHVDPSTGNLVHDRGRFFSIEGLRAHSSMGPVRSWSQPIIRQPEIGILGVLTRRVHGERQFLLQAKMEPGNVNTLQLSPTVQATRSNYERVHGGARTRHLEHFLAPCRGSVVVDVLQSEHGGRFFRKRNRNMVVEVSGDIPADGDFRWFGEAEVARLLCHDHVVNMDTRSVLACVVPSRDSVLTDLPSDPFAQDLAQSLVATSGMLHPTPDLLSWLTELKTRHVLDARLIPLRDVDGWQCGDDEIRHCESRFFRVIGVTVQAGNREVREWTQPMVEPCGTGLVVLIVKRVGGLLHLLVRARSQAGTADVIELGPTVDCVPANWDGLPTELRPRFLDVVGTVPRQRVRYDVVLSEEGGRFYRERNRHLVLDVGDDFPTEVPDDYAWATWGQLTDLARYSNYLTVQLRSVLTCLRAVLATRDGR